MKRSFRLEGELCGACAAKIEDRISRLDGVNRASVNFMTMRFSLDADDDAFADLLVQSKAVFSRIEPTCTVRG